MRCRRTTLPCTKQSVFGRFVANYEFVFADRPVCGASFDHHGHVLPAPAASNRLPRPSAVLNWYRSSISGNADCSANGKVACSHYLLIGDGAAHTGARADPICMHTTFDAST
jgi:hypothetical protein